MHPNHGTTSRVAVLARAAAIALALALGLGVAGPAVAAQPRGDAERPTWAAPWTHLGELLGRVFGGGGRPARLSGHSETDDGPDMDSDGLGGSGDDGPGMDPDGLGGSDDGPGMDPDG
jgi:hypothetical protein